MLRRVLFVAIIFYLEDYPYFQIMGMMFMNLAYIHYVVHVRPKISSQENNVDIVNEVVTHLFIIQNVVFTKFVESEEAKYQYGFGVAISECLMIYCNLLLFIYILCKKL
jgi:hypothetical protein